MCFYFAPNTGSQEPLHYLFEYRLPCYKCLKCCTFASEDDCEDSYTLEEMEDKTGVHRQCLPVIFPFSEPEKMRLLQHCQNLTVNNRCAIYPYRPYVCALFPFQIYKQNDFYSLGISSLCPYADNIKNLYRQGYLPLLNYIELLVRDLELLEQEYLVFDFRPYKFKMILQL